MTSVWDISQHIKASLQTFLQKVEDDIRCSEPEFACISETQIMTDALTTMSTNDSLCYYGFCTNWLWTVLNDFELFDYNGFWTNWLWTALDAIAIISICITSWYPLPIQSMRHCIFSPNNTTNVLAVSLGKSITTNSSRLFLLVAL